MYRLGEGKKRRGGGGRHGTVFAGPGGGGKFFGRLDGKDVRKRIGKCGVRGSEWKRRKRRKEKLETLWGGSSTTFFGREGILLQPPFPLLPL